jgi:hypothetical protein
VPNCRFPGDLCWIPAWGVENVTGEGETTNRGKQCTLGRYGRASVVNLTGCVK